jgi:hypothetical protein
MQHIALFSFWLLCVRCDVFIPCVMRQWRDSGLSKPETRQ